jgi:hypothetical protein
MKWRPKDTRSASPAASVGRGALAVVAVVDHERAEEVRSAQREEIHTGRLTHGVQVREAHAAHVFEQVVEGLGGVRVREVVEGVARADAQPHALGPGHGTHRREHLQHEAHAVGHAAAVRVGALVGAGGEELRR